MSSLFCGIEFPKLMSLFSLLFFLLLQSSVSVEIKCPPQERNYLLHFKAALVDNSSKLQSWQGFNCCKWKGVGCSGHSGGRVTLLNLTDQQLGGEIHSSLFRLEYLQYLDLSYNFFPGIPIPSDLGKLKRLTFLSLFSSGFQGKIPATLANLWNLRHLELSSTDYVAKLQSPRLQSWLKNMTRLEYLSLHRVEISSTAREWDEVVTSLSNLRYLRLSDCGLTGPLPSSIQNLFHLAHLDLSFNSFTGVIPPSLGQLPALAYLDLSANSMAGNIPAWTWELPVLFRLNLSSNKLTGRLPRKLAAKNLRFLDLKNNSLGDPLPLPPDGVSHLDMSDNHFTASIPTNIATYLQSTRVFSISGNNISGRIPDSICTTTMLVLDLSDNMLNSIIPLNFTANCSDIQVLNLGNNNLEGHIPELGKVTKLQTLSLNRNHLQGAIASSVAHCSSLQVLNLGKNDLDGTIPQWIGNLSKLQVLMLNSNKFQGAIPPQIFSLKQLQILDLSENNLSGSIPISPTSLQAMVDASQINSLQVGYQVSTDFYYKNEVTLYTKDHCLKYEIILTIFKFMDLSSNNLSGKIPPEIGSLRGLKGLNLSRNHLIGQIPDTFRGMDQLESLDLSLNNLSGKIPLELQSLSYLQVFNVSYNRLDGKIPHGGQFLTFEENSFLGNTHLCDIPFSNNSCNNSSHGEGEEATGVLDGDSDAQMEYWGLEVGLGHGLGFFIVIGFILFNLNVRKTLFHLYDGIIVAMFQHG